MMVGICIHWQLARNMLERSNNAITFPSSIGVEVAPHARSFAIGHECNTR